MMYGTHLRTALLVAGAEKSPDDRAIQKRLGKLGYDVVTRPGSEVNTADADPSAVSVVILSPTASAAAGRKFRHVATPLVVMNVEAYPAAGMTGRTPNRDFGEKSGQQQVLVTAATHPLAADFTGSIPLSQRPSVMGWGLVGSGARQVATLASEVNLGAKVNKAVIFCYDSGDTMPGLNAPARRVGLLYDASFGRLQASPYWRFFDAAVEWAAAEHPRQFPDVFRAEWSEIDTRRRAGRQAPGDAGLCLPTCPPSNLAGLALSGGGIRAATFSLGLLQGLHRSGLLRVFDYLSTVSGGGYLGGWWSAWLSRDPRGQRGSEEIFPPPELIRPERAALAVPAGAVSAEVAEEMLSPGVDPVHHLRLFSNYLTPRKGILSPDSWRAATVISRDIILTWVVLLPILIAALLLGKLYFVLQPTSYDAQSPAAFFLGSAFAGSGLLWERLVLTLWPLLIVLGWLAVAVSLWMVSGGDIMSRRERLAGKLGGVVVLILIVLGVLMFFGGAGGAGPGIPWKVKALFAAGVVVMVSYLYYPTVRRLLFEPSVGETDAARQWRAETQRYRIARVQAKLVVLMALVAFVLVLAGFGHELINYVVSEGGPLEKAGGLAALLITVAGSVFTAIKNSPSGGSDEKLLDENHSPFNRLVFRVTPTLVILVLAIALSWAANMLLSHIHSVYIGGLQGVAAGAAHDGLTYPAYLKHKLSYIKDRQATTTLNTLLMVATCFGALLSLFFVLVETRWRKVGPQRWLGGVMAVIALALVTLLGWVLTVGFRLLDACARQPVVNWLLKICPGDNISGGHRPQNWRCAPVWELCVDWQAVGVLFFLSFVTGLLLISRLRDGNRRRPRRLVPSVLILLVVGMLTYMTVWIVKAAYKAQGPFEALWGLLSGAADAPQTAGGEQAWVPLWLTLTLLGTFLYCLLFVILEDRFGSTDNRRALWLLTSVYLVLNAILAVHLIYDYSDVQADNLDYERLNGYIRVLLGQGAFGLFGVSLTWVLAMGWMADPNRLSMHNFYRARLVRAYLGASNKVRSEQLKTIRETVENDDVLLQDLGNCQRGAPYHLINTTLNLVGGRDLTTAQRSAEAFVLSKRYCGSSRTGYRDTREYMGGQLSLGTAVAVSGAAASPNMGSKTLTSSLAMLMTFLNVRLGYWAPTPHKKDWRATRARLWPFYMVREFTSQTNDLSTYCYLTDGGHFDNTGLYALVERGCRLVVVADCGADPKPCFQDVGDALRRCRIDFGAEIDLDLTPLARAAKDAPSQAHFAVGSILYSRSHADRLGWGLPPESSLTTEAARRQDELERTGVIVLFKPSVTNKDETADVRQYKLENSLFPQQTTVDQWFDEAQFESYRRLGEVCADALGDKLGAVAPRGAPHDPAIVEALLREASRKFDPRSPFKGGGGNGGNGTRSGRDAAGVYGLLSMLLS